MRADPAPSEHVSLPVAHRSVGPSDAYRPHLSNLFQLKREVERIGAEEFILLIREARLPSSLRAAVCRSHRARNHVRSRRPIQPGHVPPAMRPIWLAVPWATPQSLSELLTDPSAPCYRPRSAPRRRGTTQSRLLSVPVERRGWALRTTVDFRSLSSSRRAIALQVLPGSSFRYSFQ